MMPVNTIIQGDNIKIMPGLPPNSFDTIITDPPYGLGFMGKEWDTFKPENVTENMKRDTRTQKRRKLNVGRDFVGIEKEAEYIEIARRRIQAAKDKMGLFAEQGK